MKDDKHLREWEVARELLGSFDDKRHDLRKYGFSFITALLTAQAILIPNGNTLTMGIISDPVKITVIGVTVLLILALAFFEKNYQIIQEATVERALVLERELNLELTGSISYVFESEKAQQYNFYVYVLFVGVSDVLALAIIQSYTPSSVLGLLILISASILILHKINSLQIPHEKNFIDWTIDPLICKKGENIAITATNISNKPHELKKGILFQIVEEEDYTNQVYEKQNERNYIIEGRDSFTWLWDTDDYKVKKGVVYRLSIPQYKPDILKRKIRVE